MKAIGVIPARYGSTRLPGKSLVKLCGKPLIIWVMEAVSRAKELDDVIVATDDIRIYKEVKLSGFTPVMTRVDHPSGTDRIAEAIKGRAADIIVNIQGDEPLIDPRLIDQIVRKLRKDKHFDMATAIAPVATKEELDQSSVVKVVFDKQMRALYFSRSVIPCVRDDDMGVVDGIYWRHIGIYGYRASFLKKFVKAPQCKLEQAEKLEQLRALHIGANIAVIKTDKASAGVDTPEDVARVEKLLR